MVLLVVITIKPMFHHATIYLFDTTEMNIHSRNFPVNLMSQLKSIKQPASQESTVE